MRFDIRNAIAAFPALAALALLGACQTEPAPRAGPAAEAPGRPAGDVLDRATAARRAARIANLEYDLYVDLAAREDSFSGEVAIRFDLADAGSALTVDFTGGAVDSVLVDGAPVAADYNGYFLTIPADRLRPGRTELRIAYRHPFSQDGNGLHRFVDAEDGRTYLYSYLWPYYANRLLPSFDQPNLKAHFTLRVLAPSGWTVISAAPGAPAPGGDGPALWTFARTPKIATYMFSLHAGPYRVWTARAGDLPLRLLARRSLAGFVAVEEWFGITRRGIDFYERYFEIPYPFAKYDQVIAPEATIGGMENVAAVTYGEQFVQRRASSRAERQDRADVILHELAHMWFGDLVTHEWWNGMWLNESFATQMAALSLAEVTEFDDIWHAFFTQDKKRAYARDSRVTTHPIEGPVDRTDEFHLVWDAITYQKGASVLRQLQHFVGAENYRRGVSAYLQENAWGNTELADFIRHQEQSAGISLEDWAEQWLLRPGFNTLAAEADCDGGVLRGLTIRQSAPPEHPYLRRHRVDVALYDAGADGALVATSVIPVTVAGARTTVDAAAGRPCPVLVNPNFDDWTYAAIAPGAAELDLLRANLADVADPLSRSMFLAALFERAQAGNMPLRDYAELALALASREQDLRVLEQITASLAETVALMQRLRPETGAALADLLPRVERSALDRAREAASRDAAHLWLDLYLNVVASPRGLATARDLLAGKAEIPGMDLSPETRWRLLFRLSAGGADVADLLAAERARDPSDFGARWLLSAWAAAPAGPVKADWLAKVQDPASTLGLSRQRAVMAGLFPASQTDLQLALLDDILGPLPALSRSRDSYFVESYATTLLAPMCRPESVAAMQAAVAGLGDRPDPTALRFLREALQADGECLALRGAQR